MSLRTDIDRGLEIVRDLENLGTELKAVEERVKTAALHGEQVPLADAERGGRQFLAAGSGRTVPVIITDDNLVGSFTANGALHQTIRTASIGKLLEFFKAVNKFESRFADGKKFRAHAAEILGDSAPPFITACLARDAAGLPRNAVKIMWSEAREV